MDLNNGIIVNTISDIWSIRIQFPDGACFFNNGFGDCENKVWIFPQGQPHNEDARFFIGHFEVRTVAKLSYDDCADNPLYIFRRGRWDVYRTAPRKFTIIWADDNVK